MYNWQERGKQSRGLQLTLWSKRDQEGGETSQGLEQEERANTGEQRSRDERSYAAGMQLLRVVWRRLLLVGRYK